MRTTRAIVFISHVSIVVFLCSSVDGQYASQGKLGAAILGNYAAQDVCVSNFFLLKY